MTEPKLHSAKLTSSGRITIPVDLRRKLGLRAGTLVTLREENGRLIVTSVRRLLDEIQGSLKPRPGEPSAFEMSFEERRRERMREKR